MRKYLRKAVASLKLSLLLFGFFIKILVIKLCLLMHYCISWHHWANRLTQNSSLLASQQQLIDFARFFISEKFAISWNDSKESYHLISYSCLLASVILGVGGVCVKLFHINKLDIFHNKQCSDASTTVSLPTYNEIRVHCARISQVIQNPTHFICFAMKKYHYNSLYAYH